MSSLFNLASATVGGGHQGRSGYRMQRSVRLRSSASATLTRTPSVDGNRKTWTWSAWVKRGLLGSAGYLMSCTSQSGNDGIAALYFSSDQLFTYYDTNTANPTGAIGPAVYRDPSAWYHIVWAVDAANSIHYIYVNNVLVSTDASKYPVNYDYAMNRAGYVQNMGTQAWGAANYFDGYMTEVNFIDGQVLTPSSFGQTDSVTGVWRAKRYTGTYGTNGFYLNFSDNSAATAAALGKDYSGLGNNWTPNNISVTAGVTYDSMIDVPTQWGDGGNGRGNYCVINSIASAVADTYSQANLKWTKVSNITNTSAVGSIAISSGKWYWEGTVAAAGGSNLTIGIGDINTNFVSLDSNLGMTSSTTSYAYNGGSGPYKQNNNTQTSYGATFTTNDVIGVAFDADAGTLTFYKNNTSQGTAFTGITGTFTPACGGRFTNDSWYMNFGQRPFDYTPPTGFKALNTLNLP